MQLPNVIYGGNLIQVRDSTGAVLHQASKENEENSTSQLIQFCPANANHPAGFTALQEQCDRLYFSPDPLHEVLNRTFLFSIFAQEFAAQKTTLKFSDGKTLLVRGPNREGFVELTSGKSGLLFHPASREIRWGKSWDRYSFPLALTRSSIVENNIENGVMIIRNDFGDYSPPMPAETWRVTLLFGNTDAGHSYVAEKITNP